VDTIALWLALKTIRGIRDLFAKKTLGTGVSYGIFLTEHDSSGMVSGRGVFSKLYQKSKGVMGDGGDGACQRLLFIAEERL